MPVIKCKMCGGDIELSPDKTFGTCEYCGSTMTLPRVDDEQRAAAFNRGNHFRRIGEFDKALSVYERIVQEDENDAEAHWCCALCRFGIEYVEDPTTYEWIPTCHRLSFDSFLEDVDYLAALEHSDGITRRQYQKDAAKIAEVQRGILATSQNTEPYDVFICYKETGEDGQRTRDSIMAQDIYYQLTEQGRRVFFSRITLEDIPGSEYEPYIFAALNSARVMIVVGTSEANLNSVWVKNEWSRFLALMRKDHSKLLIPCYRDMDPYDLPEQLSVLQSYDMGKIGFIQDLLHGVGKVLDSERKLASNAPATTANVGGSNVDALLKRGQMALEDADWKRADEFFEEVLNQDAENARAYIGKALASEELPNLDALVQVRLAAIEKPMEYEKVYLDPATEHINEMKKLAVPGYYGEEEIERDYLRFDLGYDSVLRKRKQQRQEDWWKGNKHLSRAFRFAEEEDREELEHAYQTVLADIDSRISQETEKDGEMEREISESYAVFLDSTDSIVLSIADNALQKREEEYQEKLIVAQTSKDIAALKSAKTFFSNRDYKDSDELAELCEKRIKETQEEQWQQERQLERKKKRRAVVIACSASAVVIALIAIYVAVKIVIPNHRYEKAMALFDNGDYKDAIEVFDSLNGYKDSFAQMSHAKLALAKELSDSSQTGSFEEIFDLWGKVTERMSISAKGSHTVGLRSDGTVVATGNNEVGQCDVGDWTDIVAISAGLEHTVGLHSDGSVVAVGYKDNGECNVGGWTDIVAVSAGWGFTVGLRSNGTVVAVGFYDNGECDVGGWTDIVAVSAGSNHTVGLHSDGTVAAVGNSEYFSNWKDIVAISAGLEHTVGLRPDGIVVAAGPNGYGQCDVSDWTNIKLPN